MDINDFFASNPVFYPGACMDWDPIRQFGISGESKTFIYVDNSYAQDELREALSRDGLRLLEDRASIPMEFGDEDDPAAIKAMQAALRGPEYALKVLENIPLTSLFPEAPVNHLASPDFTNQGGGPQRPPFALMGIFTRQTPLPSAKQWPERITILFLGYEATTAFDLLFCQGNDQTPFAVVIQAGMHMGFGRGSHLAALAAHIGALPGRLLVVPPGGEQWDGYVLMDTATHYPGCQLYGRQDSV